jgi:hypothetical protein
LCSFHPVKRFSLVKERLKRLHQYCMSLTGASANWSQQLVVERSQHRRRVHHQISASYGQLQLKGARIVRVISAAKQSGALQRTNQLRDVHDLKASEVSEFSLARLCAATGELVKRAQKEVVRVRQSERIQSPVNGDPPLNREVPNQKPDPPDTPWCHDV